MKSFGSINISNSYIENINNYNVTETKKEEEKNDAEDDDACHQAEMVEVLSDLDNNDTVVKRCEMNKDYSKSVLKPLLTYPQQADYLIEWMHLNIDSQRKMSEKIKVIKALDSRYYFKGKVGYKEYMEEFGGKISASWFSKLMKRKLSSDEADVILESLDTSVFPIKK